MRPFACVSSGLSILLFAALLPFVTDARAEDPDTAAPPLDFREIIHQAKSRVFPAVLFVRCISESHEGGKRETQQVSGSGVLITADGEFLTNWHVVEKAVEVRCLLLDGRAFPAKVLGTDKSTDLALCRLEGGEDTGPFPCASLGDSDALTEGDFVMAMGAPWGLSRSVSLGIVACTRRYLPGNSEYSLWIQTDASISPGNSGGPLVNTDGAVIGLNTRGVRSGGDMGFAVPSATIRLVLDHLRKDDRVPWSWSGLLLQPLRDFDKDMVYEGDHGVIVTGTEPESPARRAGIKARDRLLAVNGRPLDARVTEDLPALRRLLALLPGGEPARFEVQRDGQTIEVEFAPRAKGSVEGEELDLPRWDFSVKEINQFDNPELFFYRKKGVFVQGIRQPGNAADAGLRRGDIIVRVGSDDVETLDRLKAVHEAAVADVGRHPKIVLTVLRQGLMRQIVLDFARDYERK
jgi:serine protease Do